MPSKGNRPLAIGLVAVAVLCAAMSVYYLTTNTDFLASEVGHHIKHAILFAGLAVLAWSGPTSCGRGAPEPGPWGAPRQ